MRVLENYQRIINNIRSISSNVNLVVVCKNQTIDRIRILLEHGHVHFAENRVQEAEMKWSGLNLKNIQLHLIGGLQSNKAKQAFKLFNYIHSLDSEKLANKFNVEENKVNKKLKYFIQINIGEEQQKFGISIKDTESFISFCKNEAKLQIIGLMCIPPANKEPSFYFSQLKELALSNNLLHLSMGMTFDYVDAIRNGSTYIRIGTGIFGARL
jgi:PLP dependent protein